MNPRMSLLVILVCAAALSPAARADGCTDADQKQAAVQMDEAEALERAGKLREAFSRANAIDVMCVDGRRGEALRRRVGKTLGEQEEKSGRLGAAFDWYERAGLVADADRTKLQLVKSKPADGAVFSNAYDYFTRRGADATLQELRALAAKNADAAFAEEERAFAARSVSFDELGRAADWLYYLGDDQMKRKTERAEKRGDALAASDGLQKLENALRYYDIAGRPQKAQQVRDKAMRLADGYVKTGETATAARFYALAGADDKAAEVQKRAAAAGQKKEAERQEQFRQEQDDLEKELGF